MGYPIYPTALHGISYLSHGTSWDILFIPRSNLISTEAEPSNLMDIKFLSGINRISHEVDNDNFRVLKKRVKKLIKMHSEVNQLSPKQSMNQQDSCIISRLVTIVTAIKM